MWSKLKPLKWSTTWCSLLCKNCCNSWKIHCSAVIWVISWRNLLFQQIVYIISFPKSCFTFKKSSIFWYYVEPTLAAPSLFCVDKLPLKRRLFLTGALNVSQMALSYVAKVSQNEKLFFIIQNVVIFIKQIKSFF